MDAEKTEDAASKTEGIFIACLIPYLLSADELSEELLFMIGRVLVEMAA